MQRYKYYRRLCLEGYVRMEHVQALQRRSVIAGVALIRLIMFYDIGIIC